MAEVYGHIYGAFYDFKPEVMDLATATIRKNMDELGVAIETLGDSSVLNVGTGREALVFHRLGAGDVFHFDISEKSVNNLQQLSLNDTFSNIHSLQADICEDRALGLEGNVDIVYLNGVLHHLHATEIAVNNIVQSLRPGARVFFRIYRSGSLGFFVVNFIRRLISYEDFDLTVKVAAKRFGDTEDPGGMYADVVDDFFVPVLNLFDPRELDIYFSNRGFKVLMERTITEYNHANTGSGGQGWSLYYEFTGEQPANGEAGNFPLPVDQLHGITYAEPYILTTIRLMDRILCQAEEIPAAGRIELALSLYESSQTYRRNYEASASENHERLQQVLRNFLSE